MKLNGAEIEFIGSVAELVELFNVPSRGSAVAINGDIIPRSLWMSTMVKESDNVEIVTAAAGG